ncbi:hypothetical protein PanWU01x14_196180 [Parasponia andersonii]|uniref:Uncharacterized protein n=1 Tax=Parasponia andersonii TaxID=3476 RepID=A0A2P5BZK5_PARAD|nr:hypothetical protein PanWU01x14_196180 [Parasponia andersonii]
MGLSVEGILRSKQLGIGCYDAALLTLMVLKPGNSLPNVSNCANNNQGPNYGGSYSLSLTLIYLVTLNVDYIICGITISLHIPAF